jgi:hypothetical protein
MPATCSINSLRNVFPEHRMQAETNQSFQFLPNDLVSAQMNTPTSNTRPATASTLTSSTAPPRNTEHPRLMEIILENMMKPPTRKGQAEVEKKVELAGLAPLPNGVVQPAAPFSTQNFQPPNCGAPGNVCQARQIIVPQGFENSSWHFEQGGTSHITPTGNLGQVPDPGQYYRASVQNGSNNNQFYSAGKSLAVQPVVCHPSNHRNFNNSSSNFPFDMSHVLSTASQFPNFSPWAFQYSQQASFYQHFPYPNNFNNGLSTSNTDPEFHSHRFESQQQPMDTLHTTTSNSHHYHQIPLTKTSNPPCKSGNETVHQDSPRLNRQESDAGANLNQKIGFESNNRSGSPHSKEQETKKRKRKCDNNGNIVQEDEKLFWGVRMLKEDAIFLEQLNLQLIANGVIEIKLILCNCIQAPLFFLLGRLIFKVVKLIFFLFSVRGIYHTRLFVLDPLAPLKNKFLQ